ncbi:DUF3322 and DUF2220 domain-containing protein [Cellulomonas sp. URHD0024]|uniref:DUF3322 and DUF2220 domain-containing protein n=1 Tax=Cellulomonas sp. URHD0024 TaxID=1302620 RepID=UPI000484E765|nr:DUF3322 and DUF2220 domain-containing protein [Cellulomonas sp. URHD0024]
MTARLVSPADAAQVVARRVAESWSAAVCAELDSGEPWHTSVPLSPGVTSGAQLARLGFATVHDWTQAWEATPRAGGVQLARRRISVERVPRDVPATLGITGLDAAVAFLRVVGHQLTTVDLERARSIGRRVFVAGGRLTPASLAAVHGLPDHDVDTVVEALTWLADNTDLSAWTARQLPVPGMHSKWLAAHGALLRDLAGRDVRGQVRARLAVVHLTYVDPAYLTSGGRRHDAWTAGDTHQLAYQPSTVLIVENRDCRLWFPNSDGTVVVEGGGRAVASLIGDIDWLGRATTVAYWGDIDADGFSILSHLRSTLLRAPEVRPVESILMGRNALARYAHLGVNRGADGRQLGPARSHLTHLTADERDAYHAVATAGPAPIRRIEQERIPFRDAVDALVQLVARTGAAGQVPPTSAKR